jgi:hypothetical protein
MAMVLKSRTNIEVMSTIISACKEKHTIDFHISSVDGDFWWRCVVKLTYFSAHCVCEDESFLGYRAVKSCWSWPTFQRCILPPSSGWCWLVYSNETTRCNVAEGSFLRIRCLENPKSHIFFCILSLQNDNFWKLSLFVECCGVFKLQDQLNCPQCASVWWQRQRQSPKHWIGTADLQGWLNCI